MGAIVHPGAARLDKLSRRYHRRVAEHSDQVALAACLHAQHAEPVLLVVESDPLDEASQDLRRRAHDRLLERQHELKSAEFLHQTSGFLGKLSSAPDSTAFWALLTGAYCHQ